MIDIFTFNAVYCLKLEKETLFYGWKNIQQALRACYRQRDLEDIVVFSVEGTKIAHPQ